ncbi:MAG: MerR family transcriptional regulator [Stellaceae bacterium]
MAPAKGASAFRTIGEVAGDLDLPAHVLRFWESKFAQLKPLKRRGGRRYYRPEDIVLLRRIRQCLYQDGYTIRGVQKLLGGGAERRAKTTDPGAAPSLFPLDTGPDLVADTGEPPRPEPPARRPRRAPAKPDTRAALEEIRRELLEARALLAKLMRGPGVR